MGYAFTTADITYLTSAAGAEALVAAGRMALSDRSLLGDLTRLRRSAGAHAAAVVETVRLRRRAVAHWRLESGEQSLPGGRWGADTWLFTGQALEQASPPAVALHRAERLIGHAAHRGDLAIADVTCSIGTDLFALTEAHGDRDTSLTVIGSDIDRIRLAMAAHNLRTVGRPAWLVCADARTLVTRRTLRYADPARRDASGRRITGADTVPSVAELDAADPENPPVLRLPPGIDYEGLRPGAETEIVSWNGSVREAVSWPRPLAGVRRRATVISGSTVVEQLTDADPAEDSVIAAARYLVDPDPAVVRAHLVTQYAARHGLARLDEHLAYLTGDEPPPGVRGFEILDSAPLAERTLRTWVRRDAVGSLEIKQRGTAVVPDELRLRLRPRGDRRVARTLIIARIGRSEWAFWCRATPVGSVSE